MGTADGDVTRPVPGRVVAIYLALAVGWSWTWWLGGLVVVGPSATHVPGLVGPAVAAVATDRLVRPPGAVPELRRRLRRLRVGGRWLLVGVAPVLVGAVGLGAAAVVGTAPSLEGLGRFAGLPAMSPVAVALVVFVVNGYGEEIGWRGLLWPALRRRFSMTGVAWRVAVVWALWHAPMFLLDTGLGQLDLVAVPGWFIGLAAGSLVLGWLTERSDSLLPPALFHTGINLASATDATAGLPAALTTVAVIVAAMLIGRRDPTATTRPGR